VRSELQLSCKREGKWWLGIHWRRSEDNVKMDIKEIEHEGIDWTRVDQGEVRYRMTLLSATL
jgi:hypothetical protein